MNWWDSVGPQWGVSEITMLCFGFISVLKKRVSSATFLSFFLGCNFRKDDNRPSEGRTQMLWNLHPLTVWENWGRRRKRMIWMTLGFSSSESQVANFILCDVAENISSTYAGVEIKVDSQIMMKRLDAICENLLLVSFVQHESMQLFNSCCCYQTLSETDGCLTFAPCDEGLSMYIARPRLRWTGQASPRIEILLRPKKCRIHPSSRVQSIFGVSQHLATPQPSQMVHRY